MKKNRVKEGKTIGKSKGKTRSKSRDKDLILSNNGGGIEGELTINLSDAPGKLAHFCMKELGKLDRLSKTIDEIEGLLSDPKFYKQLGPKELISLYSTMNRSKLGTMNFIQGLYTEASRNRILARLLDDTPVVNITKDVEKVKTQDDRNRDRRVRAAVFTIMEKLIDKKVL